MNEPTKRNQKRIAKQRQEWQEYAAFTTSWGDEPAPFAEWLGDNMKRNAERKAA